MKNRQRNKFTSQSNILILLINSNVNYFYIFHTKIKINTYVNITNLQTKFLWYYKNVVV